MKNTTFRLLVLATASGLLVACGSDGGGKSESPGSTKVIKGTAATGAPVATADVVVKCGDKTLTVKTNAKGEFAVTEAQLKAADASLPCAMKVGSTVGDLYSFAAAQGVANITPLTNLVLARAISSGVAGWFSAATLDTTSVQADIETATANLKAALKAADKDGNDLTFDLFSTAFKADGKSAYDAWLDQFKKALAEADVTYENLVSIYGGGNAFPASIRIDLSQVPNVPVGNKTLTITGKVTTSGYTTNIPAVVIENMVAPASKDEFCANDDYSGYFEASGGTISNFKCTYASNKGTMSATIKMQGMTYSYAYTYTWQ